MQMPAADLNAAPAIVAAGSLVNVHVRLMENAMLSMHDGWEINSR